MKKHKKKLNFSQGCIVLAVLYVICAVALFQIAGQQFFWKDAEQEISVPDSTHGAEPLFDQHRLEQVLIPQGDRIDSLAFKTCTYGRANTGLLTAELLETESERILASQTFDMSRIPDNEFVFFQLETPIEVIPQRSYCIRLTGSNTRQETAASAVYNAQTSLFPGGLRYDGAVIPGTLCMELRQSTRLWLGPHYWMLAIGLGGLLAGYLWILQWKKRTGTYSRSLQTISTFQRYRFLLKQLVERDFKTKYKRSLLGILWSFLNPLLTMTVQYIVFSTVFRNDIPNFPAYLLIGVVFFNFFSEACGMGLMSVVGNAPLITKVYVPKYIFPVSRVLSSFVNFALALIPLSVVLLWTGQRITKACLLLPFSLACTLLFCTGMALLLSAMMVFFRDVQFLWNVLNMLWMYATPIFYPETIIPEQFMFFYKMNPLYHFIRFTRIILLDGVSPEPRIYLLCVVAAIVPLLLGLALFRRTQDNFVLNI